MDEKLTQEAFSKPLQSLDAVDMLQSGSQPQEAQTSNQQGFNVKAALDCPEILHVIGGWILVDEWNMADEFLLRTTDDEVQYRQFQPQTILSCILVSKFWCELFTPLLWSVNDAKRLRNVPKELLSKYSHHVRIYDYLAKFDAQEPPMFRHLRHLVVETRGRHWQAGHSEALWRLVGANTNLVNLQLSHITFFNRKEGSIGRDNDVGNNNTPSPTNPLGHLKATLLELSLKKMEFEGNEFYYMLRDVAKGKMRTLSLGWISGSLDLQDLVFESLTRLHLSLWTTKLYDILTRSPHLEHLGIYDGRDPDWPRNFYYIPNLGPLAHFLRGTLQVDQLIPSSAHRQRTRPQLTTLRLFMRHMRAWASNPLEGGNNPEYLELIRACSNTYNRFKRTGYLGSLQELEITLRDMDDNAREAIEMHRESLEVLKITIKVEHGWMLPFIRSRASHSQDLVKILQSCRRLRELEYRNASKHAEINTMMESLMWEHTQPTPETDAVIRQIQWDCPNLESLLLYSTAPLVPDQLRLEEERWYMDDDTKGNNSCTWRIPSFTWDPALDDGTAYLLDATLGFGLSDKMGKSQSKDGEELIKRFLCHVSPSRKLKNLQLAQLKLVKPCTCVSCRVH
ncbi:hypothetical protein BGX31_005947 [Mortierella sp. GBA43]|nr:hypothetical protein BGX31_005947 [Mortierella sp. GBA43]